MKMYRPVRFLNTYSEIYERHFHENVGIASVGSLSLTLFRYTEKSITCKKNY